MPCHKMGSHDVLKSQQPKVLTKEGWMPKAITNHLALKPHDNLNTKGIINQQTCQGSPKTKSSKKSPFLTTITSKRLKQRHQIQGNMNAQMPSKRGGKTSQ